MDVFESIVSSINGVLWGYVLVLGLVGLGIYLTVIMRFP